MTFNDRNQDKNQAEATLKHSWGARFKAAREGLHFTEKDVASRLHLKATLITIIETERFESGPPPIFMRGYIRSYGRLLNMPEKEIAQALAQLDLDNPAAASTPAPMMRTRINTQQNSNSGWSTALVVLVLIGLVGMWWNNHSRNNQKDAAALTAMQSVQPAAPAATNPDQTMNSAMAPQTSSDPTPKELAGQQAVAQNPAPAANAMANTTLPSEASNPTTTGTHGMKADPVAEPAPTPTEAETATQQANPANSTPVLGAASGDQPSTLTAPADGDTEVKPTKHRHIARTKAPEMTSDDMAVPEEQGLDPAEDNNNNN